MTRLEVLRANEAALRLTLATAEPQHVAALARELRATVREIDEIGSVPEEMSVADQLAAKRAAKVASKNPASANRRSQPRRREGSQRSG